MQSPDADTAENEKMKQIEEQYKLVADRLQKQRLVMVKLSSISRSLKERFIVAEKLECITSLSRVVPLTGSGPEIESMSIVRLALYF